jgi:hypothetical protein
MLLTYEEVQHMMIQHPSQRREVLQVLFTFTSDQIIYIYRPLKVTAQSEKLIKSSCKGRGVFVLSMNFHVTLTQKPTKAITTLNHKISAHIHFTHLMDHP